MSTPKERVLVSFATAWGPRLGGINSFNYDFLRAIAPAVRPWLQVVCVVPFATNTEIAAAASCEVLLVSLGLPAQNDLPAASEPLACGALCKQGLESKFSNTHWLGHDRITGGIAIAAALARSGKSALIHHMSYAHYEAFAESSASAQAKVQEQKQLFKLADYCLAVGPLLRTALADMLDCEAQDVPMLVPGLADIQPRKHHASFKAFVSGRLDSNARKIKQGHLAIAAFAHAVYRCDNEPELPASIRGDAEPSLTLRGVDFESPDVNGMTEAEADLRRYVEFHAGRAINLHALPFTEDRKQLFDDLHSASICMMPSWHEGFGLAAWEGIAAGVPVIVSRKSGVYRLLTEAEGGLYAGWIQNIDVFGQTDEPYFREEDKTRLAALILSTAKDYAAWKDKALRLREAMLRLFSWRSCGETFIAAIGCSYPDTPPVIAQPIKLANKRQSSPTHAEAPSTHHASSIEASHPSEGWNQWLDEYQSHWREDLGLSPSQLLRAEEALVPFAPEAMPFLLSLIDWTKSTDHPLAVRLLTAGGGSGKTRLALELCQRMRAEGWVAGLLRSDCTSAQVTKFIHQLYATPRPALIVVDYAETRTDAVLLLLIALQKRESTRCTRLLLLARDSGDWWEQLPSREARSESLLDGPATTGPYTLPAVYSAVTSRTSAFHQALLLFSEKLALPHPQLEPDLSAEHFAHPLYIQLAALTATLGDRAESAEALPRALLNHERRYWLRATYSCTPAATEADAIRLMVFATLRGTVAVSKDIQQEWHAADGSKDVLPTVFRALVPLYPGYKGLHGLRPDLLGEALVVQAALAASGSILLDAALGSPTSLTRHSALTVLARACNHRIDLVQPFEDALWRQFHICAAELVQVCIETPSELPNIARRAYAGLPTARASQIAGVLIPRFQHEVFPLTGLEVDVRTVACTAAERKATKRGASQEDLAAFAKRLAELGEALRRDGQASIAFANAERAKRLWDRLVRSNPRLYEAAWATSLSNYAIHLREDGQTEVAMTVCEQALEVRERLMQRDPARFTSAWAGTLNNYSIHLMEAGRDDEALELARKALTTRQGLVKGEVHQMDPDLATSFGSYANILRKMGRIEEALAVSKQSLDIRRRLATDHPERFDAVLASALINYANLLNDAGRTDEALSAVTESLEIRQRLAQAKPERFNPDWSDALTSRAVFLNSLGRTDEALESATWSLTIMRSLAEAKPDRFAAQLATALSNYASLLREAGRIEEARDAAKQALDIRCQLAERKPERFEPNWATSLSNYANHLIESGMLQEGLEISKKATDIRHRLALARPERFEPDWATSASNYAVHLAAAGRTEEALSSGMLALRTLERLAEQAPNRFGPDWSASLGNCSEILADLGNFADALTLARQALALRKESLTRNFTGFIEDVKLNECWVAFLEWLTDCAQSIDDFSLPSKEVSSYKLSSIAFSQAVLNATIGNVAALREEAIRSAFSAWREMHSGQRLNNLGLFVLICGISEQFPGSHIAPGDGGPYVNRFYDMRRDRLPAWLGETARRLGIVLSRSSQN